MKGGGGEDEGGKLNRRSKIGESKSVLAARSGERVVVVWGEETTRAAAPKTKETFTHF